MNGHTLLLFSIVALAVIATPGPTVLLALANGSHYGVRRSVPGMLGAVLSDFLLVGAVALGLGALLAASEFWFSVLKYVGAAYLAWLGLRLLRSGHSAPTRVTSCTSLPPKGADFPGGGPSGNSAPTRVTSCTSLPPKGAHFPRGGPSENCGFKLPADAAQTGGGHPRAIFMRSFLIAATNPKGYLFCSALLPQFIDPAAAQAPQYLALALAFGGLDFSVMFVYAFIGARAVRLLRASATQWLDRACGATLLALAGSLAVYRRSNN